MATAASPLQRIDWQPFAERGCELWVKRDDLLHPSVSGNKWRKLAWHVDAARRAGACRLASCGGAYSNHLHAVAAAGLALGLPTVGYVVGYHGDEAAFTPTLQDCQRWGMALRPIARAQYAERWTDAFVQSVREQLGADTYWIPEGGFAPEAIRGCAEIAAEVGDGFDRVAVAVGSGATLAGLIAGFAAHTAVVGIAVANDVDVVRQRVSQALGCDDQLNAGRWWIDRRFRFGGFAKRSAQLEQFAEAFSTQTSVPLDPVYTVKLFYAADHWIRQGELARGARVLLIHSGGLQGKRSLLPA